MAEDKKVLNGESRNASKGKQAPEDESSNATKLLKGECSNASKVKRVLNVSKSLGLLPLQRIEYSAATNKLNKVYGNLFQNGYTSKDNFILLNAGGTVQTTNHSTVDIESGDTVQTRSHSITRQANHGSPKFWVCLRWSFFLVCFSLEVLSVALEKLSSKKNPMYALSGMVVSIITLILCIAELAWKGKQEKATWKRRGKIYWFYDPNNKPLGTFPDIFGLILGVLQFIASTITYALYIRDKNNPIDLPYCSIVFAALLLGLKYNTDHLIMETV